MNRSSSENSQNNAAADLMAQIVAAKRALKAQEAAEHLIPFIQMMTPDPEDYGNPDASTYRPAAVHRVIAEALEEVAEGKNLRLLLSVPPQHGKSELCSRKCPAWLAGKFPWKHTILASYSADLAEGFGDDVRNVINQPEFAQVFPKVSLRKGGKAKDHMVTNKGGKLSFIGRGGAGSGKPADFLFIDDIIKDAKEAGSKTIRDDCWEWFTKVAYARCHAASAIIVIMTRWHEDDLIGRLTDPKNKHYDAEESKKWTYINIPAILTEKERPLANALGIKLGKDGEAALWPERFPLAHLRSARRLNPIGFSALYMGRPTPPEGSFYKRYCLYGYKPNELPRELRYYGSCDLAVSTERDRDKSVILNWGMDEFETLWLLPDCYWGQKNSDELVDTLIDYARQYGWMDLFGEKGQIDKAIGPFLTKRMKEENVWFNTTTLAAQGNKGFRSISMRGRMAQGKVRLPFFAPWWSDAEEQILKFTGSGEDAEDDFCDALALPGAALSFQVAASKGKTADKVVEIGSIRWIKQQHQLDIAAQKRRTARKGF